jgi:hypothetical protein
MKGILYSNYQLLAESLSKLERENIIQQPSLQFEAIAAHKETLAEIYKDYKRLHAEIMDSIMRFEEHKQSIRRLIILQKRTNSKQRKNNNPVKIALTYPKISILFLLINCTDTFFSPLIN